MSRYHNFSRVETFSRCIKLYQVTCYSSSKILIAFKFEIHEIDFAHKKTSQRLYEVPKCLKKTIPQQFKHDFKFHDLLMRRFGTNILLVSCAHPNLKAKLTRTETQHGPPISKLMIFSTGRMEEHVHAFLFAMDVPCDVFSLKNYHSEIQF